MTPLQTDIRRCFDDRRLIQCTTFLHGYKDRADSSSYPECYKSLEILKHEAVQQNDQRIAKAIWCLETIAKVQNHYIKAFQYMLSTKFEEAWYHLSRSESETTSLRDHFVDDAKEFGIEYIRAHTQRFQEIFPLSLGFSAEILYEDVRCSICGAKITLHGACGHENGEIYNGDMCVRVVTKATLLGMAIVESPAQRSAMAFPKEDHRERFRHIQNLAQFLRTPWQPWSYVKEERKHLHPAFKGLRRNDACACGSGLKYKRCCLQKDTVFPHYQIYLLGES